MLAAPSTITTARLTLRRPTETDAEAIFASYAGDATTTRFMSWPTHTSLTYTQAFLTFAQNEWATQGCGTYLVEREGALIGSTGFHQTSAYRGTTGYILSRAHWGQGYATEMCRAMIELGQTLGLVRVDSYCHAEHEPSARVLEKAGMSFEGVLRKHTVFPQISAEPLDVRSYAWTAAG